MSWFKGIANRAESFLTELDNSAAQALHGEGSAEGPVRPANVDESFVPFGVSSVPTSQQSQDRPASRTVKRNSNSPTQNEFSRVDSPGIRDHISASGHQRSSSSITFKSPTLRDDDLITLLNTPSAPAGKHTPQTSPHNAEGIVAVQIGAQTSRTSLSEENAITRKSSERVSPAPQPVTESSLSSIDSVQIHSSQQVTPSPPLSALKTQMSPVPQMIQDHDQQILLENRLLRDEMESLNQEVKSLVQRNQRSEEEARILRHELENVQQSLLISESRSRELIESDEKQSEEKRALQSQCDALRVKLSNSEIQLAEEKRQRQEMQQHQQELLQKNVQQATLHKETQSSVIEELRSQVRRLKSELSQLGEDKAFLTGELEKKRREAAEQGSRADDLAAELTGLKDSVRNWQEEMAQLQERYSTLEQEHRDYREKATKILQAKEKLIVEATGCNSPGSNASRNEFFSDHNVAHSESQRLEEFNLISEELERLRALLEQRELELMEFSQRANQDKESMKSKYSQLLHDLETEKQLRTDCEEELAQIQKEQHFLQDRMMKQKNEFHEHLLQKDAEIEKLHSMLLGKQNHDSNSHEELEDRIKTLSQAVIQKQSQIDALKAEKHSLWERMNRSQSELQALEQEHVNLAARASRLEQHLGQEMIHGTHISINDTYTQPLNSQSYAANERYGLPSTHATVNYLRRFAIRTLDSMSWRVGKYTRRYPALRFFLFFYIIFLHLFVCLVLSSSPSSSTSANSLANAPGQGALPNGH